MGAQRCFKGEVVVVAAEAERTIASTSVELISPVSNLGLLPHPPRAGSPGNEENEVVVVKQGDQGCSDRRDLVP